MKELLANKNFEKLYLELMGYFNQEEINIL